MNYKIEIPKGASEEERKSYIKDKAVEGIKDLMEESPSFKESLIRLWLRNGLKIKNGFREL